ncbi:MAG TPA: DUF3078 domain-containing protein [Salinimicrobium sp.]|nr:DUF3078 domain-containing protein [Salinimicrobium sp.]
MNKFVLILFILVGIGGVNAQESEQVVQEWTDTLNVSLLFNQSAFNAEWAGGGTSNIAADAILSYQFNYKSDDWSWDNSLFANYGITKNEDAKYTRKTSDRLEFNSILGRQISETEWYYSFFTNFKTQFTKGYEYSEDAVTGEETRTEVTHFFSPAYLQIGPGFLWKKSDNLKVNIAPATSRFIFVDKDFTTTPGYVDGAYFGIDQGESIRYEFGASVSAYSKYELIKNVNIEHILNLYSNYLDNPQNIDIDYILNVNMTINKYLSTNVIFQAIYDDNTVGAFQVREVFGLAVNYNY